MDLNTKQTASARVSACAVEEPVLNVTDLTTHFFSRMGESLPAVDGVSFHLEKSETLGLVGESGCGKSVTALSVLRLIPRRLGRVVQGSVSYGGEDLLKLDEREMLRIRGNEISMIFQEPMTSLNPVLTAGQQIVEALTLHQKLSRSDAKDRAIEMLRLVHIPEPERRFAAYPHQMSGGMRQRVMIAMALSCNPKILIADEPTTALDVTIQAQILDLMRELQQMMGTAIIMITHDLGVIAEMARRVAVMYGGRKVEEASTEALFAKPRHPYTQGLLKAMPRIDAAAVPDASLRRLYTIEGVVPALTELPAGCAFAPRCPMASAVCQQKPLLEEKAPGHWVACWNSPVVPST